MRKRAFFNFKKFFPKDAAFSDVGFLLQLILIFTLLGGFLAWYLIGRAADEERGHMISAMLGRADALCGAVEGSARFLGHGSEGILAEMARQPGIAWIAIVDSSGLILQDSDAGLGGRELYSAKEIAKLSPGPKIQGRFSPEDPEIYETWKSFAPQRLHGRHCRPGQILMGLSIFIALDAGNFTRRLEAYVWRLYLLAGMIFLAALSVVALLFIINRYRYSRRQLADTRALAEQVIKSYPAALVVADREGKISFCNELGKKLLGETQDREGRKPADLANLRSNAAGRGDLATLAALDWPNLKSSLDSGTVILEKDSEIFRKNAPPLPISLSAARIMDGEGGLAGYLVVARDLDEIRKLQKKLRQSERLSALGNLAAGLAHEIRNPLSSIKGYATYLAEKLKDDPIARGAAELLAEETGRLNRVLSDLLNLAKPPKIDLLPIDPAEALSRAVDLAMPEARSKGVDLAFVGGEQKFLIRGDFDRLVQAFLNLLMNAIQATAKGGKIRAEISPTPEGLRIDISDTGCGMSEDIASQIFTPYFTTRSSGTGLGLAITQQIVEAHGGAVSVASRPGHGSVFTIEIPLEGGHG